MVSASLGGTSVKRRRPPLRSVPDPEAVRSAAPAAPAAPAPINETAAVAAAPTRSWRRLNRASIRSLRCGLSVGLEPSGRSSITLPDPFAWRLLVAG